MMETWHTLQQHIPTSVVQSLVKRSATIALVLMYSELEWLPTASQQICRLSLLLSSNVKWKRDDWSHSSTVWWMNERFIFTKCRCILKYGDEINGQHGISNPLWLTSILSAEDCKKYAHQTHFTSQAIPHGTKSPRVAQLENYVFHFVYIPSTNTRILSWPATSASHIIPISFFCSDASSKTAFISIFYLFCVVGGGYFGECVAYVWLHWSCLFDDAHWFCCCVGHAAKITNRNIRLYLLQIKCAIFHAYIQFMRWECCMLGWWNTQQIWMRMNRQKLMHHSLPREFLLLMNSFLYFLLLLHLLVLLRSWWSHVRSLLLQTNSEQPHREQRKLKFTLHEASYAKMSECEQIVLYSQEKQIISSAKWN